jgi:GTP-binding protein
VHSGSVRLLVLLTKADKLSRREAAASLEATTAALAEFATESSDIGVVLFSALRRTGLDDVATTLHDWAHP